MKKFRLIAITFLLVLCSALFSACKKTEEIKAEQLTLSDTNLVLRFNESFDVAVSVNPENATNKDFEVFGFDENVVSCLVNLDESKITITAKDRITSGVDSTIIGVKTKDGSQKEAHISVKITDDRDPLRTPRNLSFDGQNLSWNIVDDALSYSILVNGQRKIVPSPQNAQDLQVYYALNLSDYEGKNVKVQVKANAESRNLDSEYSDEIEFYIYEKPKNIKINFELDVQNDKETKVLNWDAVEYAETYCVFINNRLFSGISSTEFDITDYVENASVYEIKVKTETNAENTKFASLWTEAVNVVKLAIPENVRVTNGILQWDSVVGAVEYRVSYNFKKNGALNKVTDIATKTAYQLPFDIDSGEYEAKVCAVGDGVTSISSEYSSSSFKYRKLEQVQNVSVENGVVVWDATPYATSYRVIFDNIVDNDGNSTTILFSQTGDAEKVYFEIASYPAGDYKINIQAIGQVGTITSNRMENSFLVSKLAVPLNLHVVKVNGKNKIQWDRVNNASYYSISIANTFEDVVSNSNQNQINYEFPDNIIKVNANIVSIKCIGGKIGDVYYVNSDSINLTITKLATPELNTTNIKDGILAWKVIGETSSYEVLIKKENGDFYKDPIYLTLTSINFNSPQYNLDNGGYQVFVRAIASPNQNLYDGDYCEALNIYKYETPTISVSDGLIRNLTNTEEYSYEYLITYSSGVSLRKNTIEDYVNSTMLSGAICGVQVKVVPANSDDAIKYMSSDYSQKIYIRKMPTIKDIKIIDGILYYGGEYSNLGGFKFDIVIDENDPIDNGTNVTYDLSLIQVGSHKVSVYAVSTQGSAVSSYDIDNPCNINSVISNQKSFTKIATPENMHISSFATDYNSNTWLAIYGVTSYQYNRSGSIVWDKVSGASSYEIEFSNGKKLITDKLFTSLQNSVITGGENVSARVRALGNGTDIISSQWTEYGTAFTKLYTPNSVTITKNSDGQKIIKWTYANGQDPNSGLGVTDLISSNLKFALHVLVDERNNRIYSGIDWGDGSDLVGPIKANQCLLPEGLSGNVTLKVLAIPFNSYIKTSGFFPSEAEMQVITATNESARCVVSDLSSEVNIECLQTPTGLKMEDNVIEWSPLLYNNNDKAGDALNAYQLTFAYGESNEEKFVLRFKQGNPASSSGTTRYVTSLIDSQYLKWNFTKSNFESAFGSGTYLPNIYSVSIQAISTNTSYQVGNKTIYYSDSPKSGSISIEVLASPNLTLKTGVMVWEEVANSLGYRLYIKKSGATEVFEETEEKTFILDESYSAGNYTFELISLGDGTNTITSERNDENKKSFTKLAIVTGLRLYDGRVQYNAHSIVNASNNCSYTMFVRTQTATKDGEYDNVKYTTFELENETEFPGGVSYYIRVRATGDNSQYINSDLTDYLYVDDNQTLPKKFETPKNLKISNGVLQWDRISGISTYLINVSGGEIELNSTDQSTTYDFANIPSGKYNVKVKAVGNQTFLNSSPAKRNNVEKLKNIENFGIIDGYIVWDKDNISNYKIVMIDGGVLTEISINEDNAIIENDKIKYRLLGFDEDLIRVYIYNFGGNSSISSEPTQEVSFKKLSAPTNLSIDSEIFVFKPVSNAQNYNVKIDIKVNNSTVSYLYQPANVSVYTPYLKDSSMLSIEFSTLQQSAVQSLNIDETKITEYTISMVSIGDTYLSFGASTYYVTSDDSASIKISQPVAPTLSFETDSSNKFYGKIVWNEVEDADYYKVFVKATNVSNMVLFGDDSEGKTDSIASHNGYKYYIVSGKNFANIIYKDTYSFLVVACKNKDGFDSANSNVLQGLVYDMFEDGEDGKNNPYSVKLEQDFNAIKYNLDANYSLKNDIGFASVPAKLGSEEFKFNGTFDGNGFTLYGLLYNSEKLPLEISSSNRTFNGLFGYIGETGIVKNLTFKANIYATTISGSSSNLSNSIVSADCVKVAMVATESYGRIENVVVIGTVSTTYNSNTYAICNAGIVIYNQGTISQCLSEVSIKPTNNNNDCYVGGIAVLNKGTIEKSGFIGNAFGQCVGGITAQNAGTIIECYYEAGENTYINSQNKGKSDNFVGGIAGYMESGSISYCYVYGTIFGSTTSKYVVYVGGFVGLINNGTITNSFVIGNEDETMLIAGTGNESGTTKIGAVVGLSSKSNICSGVVCQILENQRPISTGYSMIGVEIVTNSLESSIKNNISSWSSHFEFKENYYNPTLKYAKYLD